MQTMGKNGPGRGLEEISRIFLSNSKKKEEPMPAYGLSGVTIREETCASCVNMIEGSFREPKCKIFTFENEKYGVPHLDTITLNYANYCKYFEPEIKEVMDATKETPICLPALAPEECEIEETVNIQKKIAYPDTGAGQKDMEKAFLKYLEAGYRINLIELKKDEQVPIPRGKETRKEEILIFVKKTSPSP